MTDSRTRERTGHRLPASAGEAIDRSTTVTLTFDGRPIPAHPGDTIASALTAAGVRVLSRSFKYHRPRGILCGAGHCPTCLVQVGEEPNVRACTRAVADGMVVRSQNAWPSPAWDVMAVSQLAARFMPVGFYYKTFIRPARLWPVYDRMLRHAAGLGEISPASVTHGRDKQYLHADVAVVGAGPSGLAAAEAAAVSGARVVLFDDQPAPGGHLRYTSHASRHPVLPPVETWHPNIRYYPETTVTGAYEHRWLAAVRGPRLFKVRCGALVVAAGGYEQPLLFEGNDLPGVMLAGAVERLLGLYGVAPGRRVLVVTANDQGWALAARLSRAGVEVAGIADERPGPPPPGEDRALLEQAGIPRWMGRTIGAARGRSRVRGARLIPFAEAPDTAAIALDVACDVIAVAAGHTPALELAYMVGGRSVWDEARGQLLTDRLPPWVIVTGRAAGVDEDALAWEDGRIAGWRAAAAAGYGTAPAPEALRPLAQRRQRQARTTTGQVARPGSGKRLVCYCEDVTAEDIRAAVAEGYDGMELLKRYSTVSMGPCQGRMCGTTAMHLCAHARRLSLAETGRTTARPPAAPVSLASLAGQHLEPLQRAPLHDWHVAHGASLVVAGMGVRPEHYGNPEAEVRAVREAVGLIDVSSLGKLVLAGPGTPAFLERVYTNRWRRLGVGQVRYGIMCDDEGIVLDDGVTARLAENEWYMSTTSAGASGMFEWLQWWRQSEARHDVMVVNATECYAAFNLAGPRSREVLGALTALEVTNAAFPYMAARQGEVAGVPCRVLRIGFTGELSYELHVPAGFALHLWEALLEAGQAAGIQPFGLEAQRVLRLEKAHVIVGQDTDALADALSSGLDFAVKLDKADFLGGRSLAMVSARGARQRLIGFTIDGVGVVPEEGLQIVDAGTGGTPAIIGWVSSSRMSLTLGKRIGLCWLRADRAHPGATITIWREGRLLEAVLHEGPFYDPEGTRLRA